jgi:short-subunit dehydrogenase
MALPPPAAGSTALVTGASSGIGAEIARALARRGHGVTLVARRRDRLDMLAEELRSTHGVEALTVAADLADPASRDALAAEVEASGKAVEVLVNSAGLGVYGAFADADREHVLQEVRVDVEAPVDLSARYLPGMIQRDRGAIINLSSTSALQPLPYNAGYAAAKSYLLFLSEALHSELAGTGVTVTAILPGPVKTEFQEANDAGFAERLPSFVWAPVDKVAEEIVQAAEKGKRTLIPGGPVVRAAFGPNRFVPKALSIPVAKRIMR